MTTIAYRLRRCPVILSPHVNMRSRITPLFYIRMPICYNVNLHRLCVVSTSALSARATTRCIWEIHSYSPLTIWRMYAVGRCGYQYNVIGLLFTHRLNNVISRVRDTNGSCPGMIIFCKIFTYSSMYLHLTQCPAACEVSSWGEERVKFSC